MNFNLDIVLQYGCFTAEELRTKKINRIHERALKITYKDRFSTFQELLQKGNYVIIHHKNVQRLAIEIYKVLHGFTPPILNDIFLSVSRL